MKEEIDFNNGFVTALSLFYAHRNFSSHILKLEGKGVVHDMRLCAATDHLYEIDFPNNISKSLKEKIMKFRDKCFSMRLKTFTDTVETEGLFEECLAIIKLIDKENFHIKKVVTYYS